MKLRITGIRDAGDINRERIVMKAESSMDVGEYVLMQTEFRGGSVTNGVYSTFWFPDKDINSGDFVIVYTKGGRPSQKPFKGVHSHFFYWGKSSPIWNIENRSAVLLHAPNWDSFQSEL